MSPPHPIPASHIEPAQNQPLGEPGSDSLSIVVGNDNYSSHQHMDTERQRKRRRTVPTEERKRRKIRSCRRCHDEEVCPGGNAILRCHCISLHVLCLADSEGDLMDVGVSMEGENALYCRLKLVCVEVEGGKKKRTNSDRCGLLNIIRTNNRRWSPNLARELSFLILFLLLGPPIPSEMDGKPFPSLVSSCPSTISKTFEMILASPVSVFGTRSRCYIYHSFQPPFYRPKPQDQDHADQKDLNVILMSLGVWGMDSKVCLLAECYIYSNLLSPVYSSLPRLINVNLNRQPCNRSAPLPAVT